MVFLKQTFGPEHEGREAERLEQDRSRQKVFPTQKLLLICSIGKVMIRATGLLRIFADFGRMGSLPLRTSMGMFHFIKASADSC